MASIVIAGDTSGSVTISAPAIAGTPTLTLPTTSGTLVVTGGAQTVQFAAGSAASPSITFTGDTNTGIFSPTADTIGFSEGGVESMRIDASGNVLVGTTSATAGKLAVKGSDANTLWLVGRASDGTSSVSFRNNADSAYNARIECFDTGVMTFATGTSATERMRITSSGNVGIGTTGPSFKLQINVAAGADALNITDASSSDFQVKPGVSVGVCRVGPSAGAIAFQTDGSERMRLSSGGTFSIAKTNDDSTVNGAYFNPSAGGFFHFVVTNTTSTAAQSTMYLNRQSSDGRLIEFRQADTAEGDISVSGSTVSYNGGHLSRYAQTTAAKDDSILKGTVLSNLDEMNEYVDAEGNPVLNEQLNKVKVSDVEGDVNVAGVFVNWSHDEAHNVDEINMAMTGDMIIRIAEGVVVQKGDLLMSAGDGTAKPQGDDIVRSKTVAKVTSNHVTCTYEDGSYCVPCVLMAC